MEVEILFIDFEQAFDSIKRSKLMSALKELGIHPKLRKLIQCTMKKTTVTVRTQVGNTEEFEINQGVRQGDALSTTLFNLALEYVMRKIDKRTIKTRSGQIVAYADDIAFITRSRNTMEEMLKEIVLEGKRAVLEQ
ncbi:uncharacterized protein LOC130447902 [Diorhabda sublineata]|uniref:uncharacterized protein LOC130447902 n=1 Tax=Diorhabda sublineata TaxID=1163346 RepID=UPI0024E0DD76|nr:uncharacterized protein LOC130447902 [Diorhabda sublineata]